MSTAKKQSIFRAIKRGNLDAHGNPTKVSSTKLTISGKSLPTTFRKKKYVVELSREEILKRERKCRKKKN